MRRYPKVGRIITKAGSGGAEKQFPTIELLGGNIIAVLQTSIINHEEEPEITYRGIFKDADEPVQYAPKPIIEYIWVDILDEDIEEIQNNLNWNSNFLTGARRQMIRDHVLLPNNLGIGVLDNKFVWVGSYIIPFSTNLELTTEDAIADFFGSIPRGSIFRSRFMFNIELEDWDGKETPEPGDEPERRSERIYLPWSTL